MSVIKVKVVDQQMIFTNRPVIASGGLHEDIIEFEFSDEWNGYSKAAIFYRENDRTMFVSDIDELTLKTVVPYEATATAGRLYFGVVGEKDGIIYTSELAEYEVVQGAYKLSSIINEDVYYTDIAALLRLSGRIYFSVTRNYTDIYSDNESTRILENSHFVEHFDISDRRITSITVKMNDEYITNSVYSEEECAIDIPNVTGPIDITVTATYAVWRTVTNNLMAVRTNKTLIPRDKIADGERYNATLTAFDGYEISTVLVTMGGIDVTSTVYSNGHIYIPEVTGDVVITAVANEIAPQPETRYSITNNLTHLTSDNSATQITAGYTYQATLSYESGYNTINNITITMGGVDITSNAFDFSNRLVNIQNVTGNIVITAVGGVNYTVTNVLEGATTNNNNSTTTQGYDYRATITPNSGREITTAQIKVGNATLYRLLDGNETFGSGYSSDDFYFSNGSLVIHIRAATIDNSIFINAVAEASVTPTGYTITNNLVNATNNNNATTISSGSSYTATISPASGYAKAQVIVRMNTIDITSNVYSNGTINIQNVTGNIQIFAVGVATQSGLYMIARDLRNATSDKSDYIIAENSSLGEHISFGNFDVRTYFVEMGGVDITEDVTFVDENNTITIYISHVTGNVFIGAYGSMSE